MRGWRPRRTGLVAAPDQRAELAALGRLAQRILVDDVIPFWAGTVDREHGGYRLNHDERGRWAGPSEKFIVGQARTVWFFARLARAGLASADEAQTGYRFMRDHMWDPQNQGFYWAVGDDGLKPTRPEKHLYGQAFALYALCEFASATGAREALELCTTLFEVFDERAHDHRHGGYRECFTVDWQPPPPGHAGNLGAPPNRKLFNTHLHLLEAITPLVWLVPGVLVRRRLSELMGICGDTVMDKKTGGCRDQFLPDWSPVHGPAYDRASYGHDLENVALLHAASAALGGLDRGLLSRCRTICLHALTFGRDPERGGFFASGPLGEAADRREKIWWVQAEALHGLLTMWQATGEPQYLECLSQTLAWVDARQVDRVGGDWHELITADGEPAGNKAGPWKDPYHQGRALLAVAALADDPTARP